MLPAGMEYELKDAQEPHLFIICKQRHNSASSVSSLRYYYILDGNVYQAPSLHVALASRLVSPLCTSYRFRMLHCLHRRAGPDCSKVMSKWYVVGDVLGVNSLLAPAVQSKSLCNVRTAFKLMQNDLDPLLQGALQFMTEPF